MADSPSKIINIQLGDILEIIAPDNETLNRKQFYVKYIDLSKIVLINIDNTNITTLILNESKNFEDKSINSIELLSRASFPGYAKQNNLIIGTWINIYFSGEVPFVLTGEITDLEEDMIEIKTYPDNDIIYIDFEYKGIPENIPIEKIVIRDSPIKKSTTLSDVISEGIQISEQEKNEPEQLQQEIYDYYDSEFKNEPIIPDTQLKKILIDADQIEIGEVLDEITQVVDVPESEMRYGIEKQTNDLLDELLSNIPNFKRTFSVLNNIHTIIERYTQLRTIYSDFDTNGNANIPKPIDESSKPIIKTIINLNKNLHWLLPVSHNKKKIYDIDSSLFDGLDLADIDPIILGKYLSSEIDINEMYKNGDFPDDENTYKSFYKSINKFYTPFDDPSFPDNSIKIQNVNDNILTLVNNLDDFTSSVAAKEEGFISRKQFYMDIYTKGLTYLKENNLRHLTSSDKLHIKSILTLPYNILLYSRIDKPSSNMLLKSELNKSNFAYWKIFNKDTNIRNIVINGKDDTENIHSYNPNNKLPTEYILDDETFSGSDNYEKFLNIIIPKNIQIFKNIKNLIKNNFSLHSVINFLEVFHIYNDNITYNQYSIMNEFVKNKIQEYKQNFIINYKKYNKSILKKLPYKNYSSLLKIISSNIQLESIIFKAYGFSKDINYSDSEVLNIILNIDYGKLFTIAVIKIDFDLQTTNLIDNFVKKYEEQLKIQEERLKKGTDSKCKSIVKKYTSKEKLLADSGLDKQIYVDSEYNNGSAEKLVEEGDYAILIESIDNVTQIPNIPLNKPVIVLPKKSETSISDSKITAKKSSIGDNLESLQTELAIKASTIPNSQKSQQKEPEQDKPEQDEPEEDEAEEDEPEEDEPEEDKPDEDEAEEGESGILSESSKSTSSQSGGVGDSKLVEYYVRNNSEWIKDDKITNDIGGVEVSSEFFCNLQEECISDVNKECTDMNDSKRNIEEETLKAIYNEFDDRYGEKENELKIRIDNLLLSSIERIKYLKKLEKINFYKYNNIQKSIGDTILNDQSEDMFLISPYENLRDIILGQVDMVKKQYDIQKFVLYFTRKALEHEEQYWLYCSKTNVKLLPTFLSHLANVYVSNGDYLYELDKICTNQGTISDDGEAWVDKYSGYFIKNIDLDTEEGFTEEGFKLKTREILEKDLGDAILEEGSVKPDKIIQDDSATLKNPDKDTINKNNLESEESKIILNIISAITGFMGINLENEKDFIIRNTLKVYTQSVPNEKAYNTTRSKALEKGKKNVPTYEDTKNTAYLIITFVFILIGIQVSIPSIKSRKTFPGCIKSFTGYPLVGTDKSALIYVACVANKIKSTVEPWNSIKKKNEATIIKHMESIIEQFVLNNQSIKERFNEKIQYLNVQIDDTSILEYDVVKLSNFYPPLFDFKIENLSNISDTFKESLIKNIKSGSYFQEEQILTIKSKIIFYSLSIQEKIQKIINKKAPLITNNASQPFLENACCDDRSTNIHKFFIQYDNTINTNNNIVSDLDNILYDLNTMSKPPVYFDSRDTKYKFPQLGVNFSKDTIYKSFVVFCNKKSTILNENLRAFCSQNYDIEITNDSIEEKIKKLKEDGINYDEDLLQKLLIIINTKNSLNLNLDVSPPNSIEILRDLLENLKLSTTKILPDDFVLKFLKLLDVYSIEQIEDTAEARDFRNYLAIKNDDILKRILNFIRIHSKISKTKFKNFQSCLENITNFIETGDNLYINSKDETNFKIIHFIQNSIRNIIDIFPNIILNRVNYSSINIPKHWKLSQRHVSDIKEIVNKYYLKLKQYYNDPEFNNILINIQSKSKNIELLAKHTPFFASIIQNSKEINSIFDKKLTSLLFKYYLLSIIDNYISINEGINQIKEEDEEDFTDKTDEQDDKEMIDEVLVNSLNKTSEKFLSPNKLSDYLITIIDILCNDKDAINFNYETIMEKILRSKEKEKDTITDFLKNLTDEEREIENIFKNQKLEKWSKGLQKGLTQYVQETYDEEMEDLEKQAIKDRKLASKNGISDANKNIFALDLDEQQAISEEIDKEVYSLDDYPDDYADHDEYGEDYYRNEGY